MSHSAERKLGDRDPPPISLPRSQNFATRPSEGIRVVVLCAFNLLAICIAQFDNGKEHSNHMTTNKRGCIPAEIFGSSYVGDSLSKESCARRTHKKTRPFAHRNLSQGDHEEVTGSKKSVGMHPRYGSVPYFCVFIAICSAEFESGKEHCNHMTTGKGGCVPVDFQVQFLW